jgi:hypothetical protein
LVSLQYQISRGLPESGKDCPLALRAAGPAVGKSVAALQADFANHCILSPRDYRLTKHMQDLAMLEVEILTQKF